MKERQKEHEAVKMIRLKSGLVKWSNAHKEFATKSSIVFSATHDIAQLIPDAAVSTEIQVYDPSLGFIIGTSLVFLMAMICS